MQSFHFFPFSSFMDDYFVGGLNIQESLKTGIQITKIAQNNYHPKPRRLTKYRQSGTHTQNREYQIKQYQTRTHSSTQPNQYQTKQAVRGLQESHFNFFHSLMIIS